MSPTRAAISSGLSLSAKAGIWVAGRPFAMVAAASSFLRRPRFSGRRAGAYPPEPVGPVALGAVVLEELRRRLRMGQTNGEEQCEGSGDRAEHWG